MHKQDNHALCRHLRSGDQLFGCPPPQGRILMWDVQGSGGWADGRIQGYCRHFDGFQGKITALAFCNSPSDGDGPPLSLMAASCADGTLRVEELDSGQCLFELRVDDACLDMPGGWQGAHRPNPYQVAGVAGALRISLDGALLAVSGASGVVTVWGLEAAEQLAVLRGHDGAVRALEWSGDGGILATAGSDGVCRLWDLSTLLEG